MSRNDRGVNLRQGLANECRAKLSNKIYTKSAPLFDRRLTVGAAFAATYLASKLVEPGVSPLFLLAVMISAWRGGLGSRAFRHGFIGFHQRLRLFAARVFFADRPRRHFAARRFYRRCRHYRLAERGAQNGRKKRAKFCSSKNKRRAPKPNARAASRTSCSPPFRTNCERR
jgi:hypothetical protein